MNSPLTWLTKPPILFIIAVFFFGCSKKNDETPRSTPLQGTVEKGPFVRGSVVTVNELGADLAPTGRTFKSEIVDDKGTFSLSELTLVSNFVQISVHGYYFDEVNGKLSSSQITLNALADVSDQKQITVNVLSHLEEKRVRSLVKKDSKSFGEAKKQALTEIYSTFFVKTSPTITSESVSLTNNDDHAAVLLAISAALIEAADSDNARLTELLSKISVDMENDGIVESALRQQIKTGLESIYTKSITENIKKRYQELNTTLPDFSFEDIFTVELKEYLTELPNSTTDDAIFSDYASYSMIYSAILSATLNTSEQYFKLEGLYSKTISGLPTNSFYLHRPLASDGDLNALFSSLYRNVNMTNTVMDQTKTMSFPSHNLSRVYPYFAYQYWVLMNVWGNSAFINTQNYKDVSNFPARAEKSKLSRLLLTGLDSTIQKLIPSENVGTHRMDLDVARVVAARIAADNGDYTSALKYVNQLIDSRKYTLASKSQIHTSSSESIFGYDYRNSQMPKPAGYDALYGKGDYRSIIRYTEVILLAAECKFKGNNKTEAAALLNQVRLRNGKAEISGSESDFLSLLQDEVKEDLKNEGVYFAFLKRHNLAESVLGIKSYQKLLPIPQREINLNRNMVQNPGY